MKIRSARPDDAAGVAGIYAHHVAHGLGTFEEIEPTPIEMAERMAAVQSQGLPYLVAEDGEGGLSGFAYAAPFRPRASYRYTVEDSIYLAPDAVGKGLGRALLSRVIDDCDALGLRQVTAVIGDTGNKASIGLHTALGFEHTGTLTSVGFKHGRWLDVVLMQKSLNGGSATPPTSPGLKL